MKKKVKIVIIILLIVVLAVCVWFIGYHTRKSQDNLLSLESIAEKSDYRSNEITHEEYNRVYKERRALAMSIAQNNLDKAMKIEGFPALYERVFGIEKDLAFAEISGDNEKLKGLEKEQQDIMESIASLLKNINLSFSDLSPKYACEKCNDTGYVGTNRCDCLNKK